MEDPKNTIKVSEIHDTVDTLRFEKDGDFVNAENGGDYHSEQYTHILDTKYLFGVEYAFDYKKYCALIENTINGLYEHRLDIRSNTHHEKTRNDVMETESRNNGYYETDDGVGELFFPARISVDVYDGNCVYVSLDTDGIMAEDSGEFGDEIKYEAQAVYEDFVFDFKEVYSNNIQSFIRQLTECIVFPIRETLDIELTYEIRRMRECAEKVDNLSNALQELNKIM